MTAYPIPAIISKKANNVCPAFPTWFAIANTVPEITKWSSVRVSRSVHQKNASTKPIKLATDITSNSVTMRPGPFVSILESRSDLVLAEP
jgi:hypothetical protein